MCHSNSVFNSSSSASAQPSALSSPSKRKRESSEDDLDDLDDLGDLGPRLAPSSASANGLTASGSSGLTKLVESLPTHEALNKKAFSLGQRLRDKIDQTDIKQTELDVNARMIEEAAKLAGTKNGFLKSFKKKRGLEFNKFEEDYRGWWDGMDEHLSTSTVREIVKGIFSKGEFGDEQKLKLVEQLVDVMSLARLPTSDTGFKMADDPTHFTQHVTSKESALFHTPDETRSTSAELDRSRKTFAVTQLEKAIDQGKSAMQAIAESVSSATRYTLKYFAAPSSSESVLVLKKEEIDRQVRVRDQAKRAERLVSQLAGQVPEGIRRQKRRAPWIGGPKRRIALTKKKGLKFEHSDFEPPLPPPSPFRENDDESETDSPMQGSPLSLNTGSKRPSESSADLFEEDSLVLDTTMSTRETVFTANQDERASLDELLGFSTDLGATGQPSVTEMQLSHNDGTLHDGTLHDGFGLGDVYDTIPSFGTPMSVDSPLLGHPTLSGLSAIPE